VAGIKLLGEYFEKNYVLGVIARGRRRGIRRRYPSEIWNKHQAALTGSHKTNNVSEGWQSSVGNYRDKNF